MMNLKTTLVLVLLLFAAGHPVALAADTPSPERVFQAGKSVADWQLRSLGYLPADGLVPAPRAQSKSWEIAAFWIGLARFADITGDQAYRDALLEQGRKNDWQLGPWLEFADDHAIGQSYLWASRNGAGPAALEPMSASFDRILAEPPRVHLGFHFGEEGYHTAECLVRWCWCDALFMSPPAMIGLSLETGDGRYADYAFSEFWSATDFLFDPAEKLYFRDSRFFAKRDGEGRKLFWSRGNGWVFAGIANILDLLPEGHAERPRLEALFREMAQRLLGLQKEDGYWPPSLLAPEDSPPETSGTGFFTYGLAYGVNEGLLDRKTYLPAVIKGWQALARAVDEDGRLGWVQQVSDRPEDVAEGDTHYYGAGAFLLAASEVARINAGE